jgi:hypothetical protein
MAQLVNSGKGLSSRAGAVAKQLLLIHQQARAGLKHAKRQLAWRDSRERKRRQPLERLELTGNEPAAPSKLGALERRARTTPLLPGQQPETD